MITKCGYCNGRGNTINRIPPYGTIRCSHCDGIGVIYELLNQEIIDFLERLVAIGSLNYEMSLKEAIHCLRGNK